MIGLISINKNIKHNIIISLSIYYLYHHSHYKLPIGIYNHMRKKTFSLNHFW